MKIVCAWCNKVLTEYESYRHTVSHGICPECLRGLVGVGAEISLKDFIDRLGFPVMLVDRSASVQRVNGMAAQAFGRPGSQLEDVAVGLAIECQNAFAPGGCGRMEHCAGCVLRGTILGTHADGQPRYGVYSRHEVMTAQGAAPKRFRFSTSLIGDAVMLAIEEVQNL
jgi:hypothetical protein